jgi:23S rRNA U2552 (ribose-2'-O)-methylase RlmE/FtsJ
MNSYTINETIALIDEKDIMMNDNIFYINNTLKGYIHLIKKEIETNIDLWERNKKYLNPYEFINTNYDSNTSCVCSYKPISRAFFKMIEILNNYNFSFPKNMKSFHLAEGPGGFIEALQYYRNNENDKYYGITLLEGTKDIPKWDKIKHFLYKHPNIHIEKGADNTGNLYNIENLQYIYKNYKHSIDFITGDGGFDFSIDFNKQEENSLNLIISEVFFAINLQKKGGSFVCKVFDLFSYTMVQILYILSSCFEEVYIYKPETSRPANSEKYLVCMYYKDNLNDISKSNLLKIIELWNDKTLQLTEDDSIIFKDIKVSNSFIQNLK